MGEEYLSGCGNHAAPPEKLREQERYTELVRELTSQLYGGGIPKFYVHSYGCQLNVSDGEKLKGMLKEMGYGETDSLDEADIIIYNTCAVRENAEDRAFGNLGALKAYKRRKPSLIIAMCGCMTQQEQVAERIKKVFTFVDIVFGTHASYRLPEMVYTRLSGGARVFDLTADDCDIAEGVPVSRDSSYKAWLPVMYGCDNFCSYCIVPYVRGRERSREPDAVVAEAKDLVSRGYKEIMLLGQNVNSYGAGLEEKVNFSELLRRIDAIDGDYRIRFMTSHPKDCTHELIDTIAASRHICRHIHLPVQCGSNRILKLMNRRYTVEQYVELIDYARSVMPDVTLSSDIIVGFPGESYEDFCGTLELLRRVRFNALYTFIYSKREGTVAAKMDDPVPYEEKSRWFTELLGVQQQIADEYFRAMVGREVRVLPEEPGKADGTITGRDDGNTIVNITAPESMIGSFVRVKIDKAYNWAVGGVPVEQDGAKQ